MSADAVERRDAGDVTVLRVNLPRLWGDGPTDEAFDRLFELVEGSGGKKFVLDLGAIEYFSSAALGKLVTLNRKALAGAARLVLCNVTPTVQRMLEVTRLVDVLIGYDTEREAVRALA